MLARGARGTQEAGASGRVCPSHPALRRVCLRHTKSVRTSAGVNKLHTVLTGYLTFQLPSSVNELYCERFQTHHALSRRPAWKPVLHLHLHITSNFLLDSVHNVPVSRPEKTRDIDESLMFLKSDFVQIDTSEVAFPTRLTRSLR